MNQIPISHLDLENKENSKSILSNSLNKNYSKNASSKSISISTHDAPHQSHVRTRVRQHDCDDVSPLGGVLANLSLLATVQADKTRNHEKNLIGDKQYDSNHSDSESTISLQSSYYQSKQHESEELFHTKLTKIYPTPDNKKNKVDVIVSPKPPTTQVSYQRQNDQIMSPLEFDQSPMTAKNHNMNNNIKTPMSFKSSVHSSPLDSSSSPSASAYTLSSTESKISYQTIQESSREISIYKPKSKRANSKQDKDEEDDSFREEDDDDSHDASSCDDDNYTEASYIVEEPYIPYGKTWKMLNSTEKSFVKNEMMVSEDEDENADEELSSNYSDSEVESDDHSNSPRASMSKRNPEQSSILNSSNVKVIFDKNSSIDDESQVTIEAQVLSTGSLSAQRDQLFDESHSSDSSAHESSSENQSVSSSAENELGPVISKTNAQCKSPWKKLTRHVRNKSNKSDIQLNSVKRGKWSLGERIGEGSFGVVYVGMNNISGKLMAVKSLHIPMSSPNEMMGDLQREIELMQSFNHPNIVRYIGCEMDRSKNAMFIFQEWVTGGCVTSLLKKFGPFPITVVRSYFHQILCGLEYLHRNRILHRDIKGGNVLVNDEGVVKLADFGASKKIHVALNGTAIAMEDLMEKMTVRGTPYFMAPEVFEATFSVKADVWSAGCVAYQMYTGNPPWKSLGFKSPTSLFMHLHKTSGPPPFQDLSQDEDTEHNNHKGSNQSIKLRKLLTKCFHRNASKRPTVSSLLSDVFFSDNTVESFNCDDDCSTSNLSAIPALTSALSKNDSTPQRDDEEMFDKQDWPLWAQQEFLKPKNNSSNQFL